MTDMVRLWSDELARDPGSLVFLPLAETLRQRGQLDLARKITTRGLERHPHDPEAHDLMARIHADRGDLQAAFDEWDVVLRLVPGHLGAIKGMAFIRFQQGEHEEAERLLLQVRTAASAPDVDAAIDTVRRSGAVIAAVPGGWEAPSDAQPSDDPHRLFDELLAGEQAAMLLDREGRVLAGSYYDADGRDVAQEVGARLSGVSDEARRATRHLDLGGWRSIVFETEAAVVALAPASGGPAEGGLLLVAAARATPLGQLRRVLERCARRVASWLGGEAG